MQSTITDKFQTTIPSEVRPDGSAVMLPVPPLDELFGRVKLGRPVASARDEKRAARNAIAREASAEGKR